MTRSHRRWHAWTWLVLGPLTALGFAISLLARPLPVVESTTFREPQSGATSQQTPSPEPAP
jgi:hypothetical protein